MFPKAKSGVRDEIGKAMDRLTVHVFRYTEAPSGRINVSSVILTSAIVVSLSTAENNGSPERGCRGKELTMKFISHGRSDEESLRSRVAATLCLGRRGFLQILVVQS